MLFSCECVLRHWRFWAGREVSAIKMEGLFHFSRPASFSTVLVLFIMVTYSMGTLSNILAGVFDLCMFCCYQELQLRCATLECSSLICHFKCVCHVRILWIRCLKLDLYPLSHPYSHERLSPSRRVWYVYQVTSFHEFVALHWKCWISLILSLAKLLGLFYGPSSDRCLGLKRL